MLSPRGWSGRPKWPRGQNFGLGPKFWPQPQTFGLGLETLALASNIWPQPGLDLVVLLCNRTFFRKNRVKFRNFVNFSGSNLKSYVVNHYFVFFHNYFLASFLAWTFRNLPWPLSSGLGLEEWRLWPRLTYIHTYIRLRALLKWWHNASSWQ